MADQTTTDPDAGILSLSTQFERPKIRIDDAIHELLSPDELSIEQSYRIADLGRKLGNLRKTDGLKPAQQKQLHHTLESLCAIIMEPVPNDVRAKLSDVQRLDVVEVFSWLLPAARLKRVGATAIQAMAGQIGANPLPGSSASMAGAPTDG